MVNEATSKLLTEFGLIDRYFRRTAKHDSIVQTIGDDCALLTLPDTYQLALSMDTLVEGVHFPSTATPQQIATRAFCSCLSDLAAMGATPRWFTLALTLPDIQENWLAAFSEALSSIAADYGCELVGGDTTKGPLTITLQVHGWVEKNQALLRSGAQAGDHVYVTNTVGDGRAALDIILHSKNISEKENDYLLQRFYRPDPQIHAGQCLLLHASSAIDISDGLLADLQHIANASHVEMMINVEQLPISSACKTVAGQKAHEYALCGGDDYQLAFTVPQKNVLAMESHLAAEKIQVTRIGHVSSSTTLPVVHCYFNEELMTIDQQGYQHFAS